MNGAASILERGAAAVQRSGVAPTPALLCGDTAVGWDALIDRVARAAGAFVALGVAPQERVFLLSRDTPALVVAYLGAMWAGAVPVALGTRSIARDVAIMLADGTPRLLLVDPEFLALAQEALGWIEAPPRLVLLPDIEAPTGAAVPADLPPAFDALAAAAAPLPPADLPADAQALWIYTSGTTGAPKAAVHGFGSLAHAGRLQAEVLGCRAGERVFCASKLFFAFALGHALLAGLACGATVVLLPEWPTATAVADTVRRFRPHLLFAVPTQFRNLLREGCTAPATMGSVRHFVSAGEALPVSLYEDWLAATGRPILEGLGATETLFLAVVNQPDDPMAGTLGRAAPGSQIAVRDDVTDRPVVPGNPGTLWVAMPSVAQGYWNDRDRSNRAFRHGWYRTGDMVSEGPDGRLRFHGRVDDMLKIAGQWVSPAEIEEAALGCPGVQEAAVVGFPAEHGLARLALFMVRAPERPEARTTRNGDLTHQVTAHLSARLAAYKVPRMLRVLPALPRTATGKLKRASLRAMMGEVDG